MAFGAGAGDELGQVAQTLGVGQPDARAAERRDPPLALAGASVGGRRRPAGVARVLAEPLEQGDVVRGRDDVERRQGGAAALASSVAPARSPVWSRRRARSISNVARSHGQLPCGRARRRSSPAAAIAWPTSPVAASTRARAAAARAWSAGMSRSPMRLVSSAHVAAAASISPRASSASTSTVSSSTARSRSSPMTRRPRSAAARARSWSPRARCRRAAGSRACKRLVLAEQQRLGVGEPTLADAEVGEGDVRMPARRLHGALERRLGPHEHGLGLAPPSELHQQRGLHAVAVAGEEHRRARRPSRSARAGGAGRPTTRRARSRR